MAEKFEEKTEQATPRRCQKAREKGETAKSKEITGVIPIWIFFLVLVFGCFMFMPFLQFFMASLERGFEVTLDKGSLVETVRTDIFQIVLIVAPPLWADVIRYCHRAFYTDRLFVLRCAAKP
ncbi:EscU/YscU/HrcU family type III secretion system export apparatus switch protein [Thermodesulfovibrionales bacterium]|nr:EscU/YscU/HrcU family type III secretion system export apparatus switch protein [Thermodesulfovibrionales bacterium]